MKTEVKEPRPFFDRSIVEVPTTWKDEPALTTDAERIGHEHVLRQLDLDDSIKPIDLTPYTVEDL